MGHVTNIVLLTGMLEDDNVKILNEWINTNYREGMYLKKIDENAGGNKALEVQLYTSAFNYFPLKDFIGIFSGIEWVIPEEVLLIYQDEHDDEFTVVKGKEDQL